MNRFTTGLVTFGVATASVVLLGGCSSDSNTIGNQFTGAAPSVAAVSPADGAINVSRTTTIGMRFTTPMDTNSVMGAFHLAGGPEMGLWMDSVGHHQGMMGGGMMNMGHMMQWMDSIEYHGQWHWNANRDSCWFAADSMLVPNADHMIYLYGDMRSQSGMMMKMDTMQYGGPMYHFHTQP
jgi:hypothetical protein